MRLRYALIAAMLFTAGPAMAQTPPGGAQQKPAPSAPVQPGQTAAAPAEKLDPAKETAIRHLLDITGGAKEGENINEGMTGRVRGSDDSRASRRPVAEVHGYVHSKVHSECAAGCGHGCRGEDLRSAFLAGGYSRHHEVLRIPGRTANGERNAGCGSGLPECWDGYGPEGSDRCAARNVRRISAVEADASAGPRPSSPCAERCRACTCTCAGIGHSTELECHAGAGDEADTAAAITHSGHSLRGDH